MAFSTDNTSTMQGFNNRFNNATSCAARASEASGSGDKYAKLLCLKSGKRVSNRDTCRKAKKPSCPCRR